MLLITAYQNLCVFGYQSFFSSNANLLFKKTHTPLKPIRIEQPLHQKVAVWMKNSELPPAKGKNGQIFLKLRGMRDQVYTQRQTYLNDKHCL